MNISYKRNGGMVCMILDSENPWNISGYEEEMLKNNVIPNLLPFYIIMENGESRYWYEITGLKSIKDVAERDDFSPQLLADIIASICEAYKKLSHFLIPEEHIYLTPETAFVSLSDIGTEVSLCYCPEYGRELRDSVSGILEYFLEIVGGTNEKLTNIVIDLYDYSLAQEFSCRGLLEILDSNLYDNENDRFETDLPGECSVYETGPEPFDDDFTEEDQIEEKKGLFSFFAKLFGSGRSKSKNTALPPKDLEEEFVYSAKDDQSGMIQTVLISESKGSCGGRLLYEGEGDEDDYDIKGDVFYIGSRDSANNARLRSPTVSRRHAKIVRENDNYYLEDMNSTNGTFVNDKQLTYREPVELKYMDKLKFADVVYRFM